MEGGEKMRKLTIVVAVAIAILAWSGISFAYSEGYWGLGPYPCVGLPTGATITVDGDAADWSWFPAESVIPIDDMGNTLGAGAMPDKSDLDIAIMAAWSPDKLYVFVNVIDDTLNIDETSISAGWKDDRMEIIMDADHSNSYTEGGGGLFREDMQQYVFDIMTPGGYHQVASLQYHQDDMMRWAEAPEYTEAVAKVLPAGSVHGATNVTVGYEVKMTCFDWLSRDGYAASTEHVFAEGQIIGMGVTVDEADLGGRNYQISTHAPAELGCHDPALCTEFEMLGAPTAVEPKSWGTIKALFR
jgi:hypothetical protein